MKKRLLLVISIIVLAVVTSTMLFACSSSDKFDGSSYEKMEKFYADAKGQVKKCETTLDGLMSTIGGSSFSASFRLERTYYSTADDSIQFKGDPEKGGYKENADEDKTLMWMVDAIDYTFDYKNGDYKITAIVYDPVESDKYNKKEKSDKYTTYVYMKVGDVITKLPDDRADYYCYDKMYSVIFGQFTNDEFLENYVTSAEKGFRFVSYMMQYQITRAYKYDEYGAIDENAVIKYEENKDKLLYTALEESYTDNKLAFSYNGEAKDIAGDDISYWAAYGEDITYNLYKTAAIYNDRVTMTYKKKSQQIQSYEYYGERVLPFYTQKSDFKTYKVLKAVVADYTHFIINFEYKDVTIA